MWMQENNTVRRFCVVAAVSIGLCSVGHATTINLRIGTLWDQYSDDGNEGAGLAVADGWQNPYPFPLIRGGSPKRSDA